MLYAATSTHSANSAARSHGPLRHSRTWRECRATLDQQVAQADQTREQAGLPAMRVFAPLGRV
jgi:hypothetical protein